MNKKIIHISGHHKETFVKRYENCNIAEKGLIKKSHKMMSIVKTHLLRRTSALKNFEARYIVIARVSTANGQNITQLRKD